MATAQPLAGADLGILGGISQNNDEADDAQPSTSTRERVYEALLEANLKGSFCAGGPADGTTTAPALPTTLGLRITGLGLPSGGDVPLPVTDALLKTIKAKATKVADKSFRNVYEVDRKKIRIQNPAWEASVAKLVQHCAYKLGVHPNNLMAELDRLLVMGKGGRIDRCSDVEENGDVLGTLLIQLPSKFAGGDVGIFSTCYYDESYEDEEEEEEEKTSAFSFDTPGDEFVCHFVCHFSDVEYEFSRVNSGSRVLLRYTLLHRGPHKPTAGLVRNSMEELEWSLAHLPPVESMVLFPLAKEYKDSALVNRGINALSHPHRVNAEAIMAAGEGWKLLVINAKLKYTHTSFGRDGDVSDSFNNASISGIFDERGIDVSSQMKWVKDVASFDCVSSDGMLLTSSKNGLWCDDIFYDDWGRCKHEKNSSTGDDSDDYGGYTYDRDVSHTTEKWYQSSFLLAYRLSADPELKASGGVRGTAEVAKQIVATHDYNLLKRLLSIVSANKKSELDVRSCHLLLQMLTEATDKGSSSAPRIEMANGIVLGLGRSFQPSSELYAILLSAIDRFGRVLADSIFKLWSEYDRLHNLELVGYLRRADFALKLNNRVGTVVDYVDAVVRALKRDNGAKVSNSGDVNKVLLSLTGTHGWDKTNTVIKATLDSLHKTASKSIVDLLNRAILLSRVEASKQCSFIDGCTSDFAKTFAEGLASDYRDKALARLTGNDKGIFLQAIRYVLERGGSDEHLQFGNWAKSKQGRLSALSLEVTDSTGKHTYTRHPSPSYNFVKIKDVARISAISYSYARDGDGSFVPEGEFTQENWSQMGEDMSKFVNLKRICFDGLTIWNREEYPQSRSLFKEGRCYHCRLEELRFRNGNGMPSRHPRDETIVKMVPFIKSMASLKILDLSHNHIEDAGAMQIARAIQEDHRIEKLYLDHNFIWDNGIACILNSARSKHFVELHIHDNRSYVKKGRNAIMSFLSREDNAIESFGVDCKEYKYATRLINSIPKKSKLVELVGTIGSGHDKAISAIAPCLGSLICDTSNINALCNSNHRLRYIGCHTGSYLNQANRYAYSPHKSVGEALRIQQEGSSEAEIIRAKIRTLYFIGEFVVQPFMNMGVALMPLVLALVTRREFTFHDDGYHSDYWRPRSGGYEVPGDNLNAVYRLVKNCHMPEMFCFPSPDVRIASLEAENETLRDQNERLLKEVAELEAQLTSVPKKRAKKS